jgi:uncharacterized protein (TIGR03067 family)
MTPSLLAGVLLLTAGAPNLKDPPPKPPSLVGRWANTEILINGTDGRRGNEDLTYEFTADGRWLSFWGGKDRSKGETYVVDPKARPAAIDLPTGGDWTMRGIYKVEGDTLTLVLRVGNGPRPAGFGDTSGGLMKMVMTRVKD